MGELVKLFRSPAPSEVDRLIQAVEAGGLLVYLMIPDTSPPSAFVAFEFSSPVVTHEGMTAAHVLRDRFNSDGAFKKEAANYMLSVGAAYGAGRIA